MRLFERGQGALKLTHRAQNDIRPRKILREVRVRVAHGDAIRAGALRGEDADVRVLEDDAALRRDAELPRRDKVGLGVGLRVRDLRAVDDELERVADAEAAE